METLANGNKGIFNGNEFPLNAEKCCVAQSPQSLLVFLLEHG